VEPENLIYAAVQVAHNFGAAAVVGGPLSAILWVRQEEARRQIAWLVMAGWLTQLLSGAGFALTSLHFYEKLPDVDGIAFGALVFKIACALIAMGQGSAYLWRRWDEGKNRFWYWEAGLGITAMIAAGFLRWFS
jgi:hypothetical protein